MAWRVTPSIPASPTPMSPISPAPASCWRCPSPSIPSSPPTTPIRCRPSTSWRGRTITLASTSSSACTAWVNRSTNRWSARSPTASWVAPAASMRRSAATRPCSPTWCAACWRTGPTPPSSTASRTTASPCRIWCRIRYSRSSRWPPVKAAWVCPTRAFPCPVSCTARLARTPPAWISRTSTVWDRCPPPCSPAPTPPIRPCPCWVMNSRVATSTRRPSSSRWSTRRITATSSVR
ncbi:hypothetical protein D3C75_632890 [compost metagenome]